jgi:hypothetical protein
MKTCIGIILPALLICACGEKETICKHPSSNPSMTFEMDLNGKDTVNRIDQYGFKQGKWRTRDGTRTRILEAGNYVNNLKQGYWTRYNKKGEFIDSVLYKNDSVIY